MKQKKCKWCENEFVPVHFNQSLCSEECRVLSKRSVRSKYKETEKGKATEQRWVKSDKRKQNEKRYKSKPLAKQKTVVRVTRYLEEHEHIRTRKKQSDILYSQSNKGKAANRLACERRHIRRSLGIGPRPTKTPVRLEEGNSFTLDEWNSKLAEYNNACACCDSKNDITMDHIVPLSKGGTNTIDNIQPLCRSCNAKKGVKIIRFVK